MRLFNKNKSQASIDRAQPQSSRDSSPTHHEPPSYPPSQPYSTAHQFTRPVAGNLQDVDPRRQVEQGQSHHPAHILTRSQSHRQSLGPESLVNQLSVNVIAPNQQVSVAEGEQVSPDSHHQTQFGQPRIVHAEKDPKEHKKSKRSIFGFSAKEKEAASRTQQQQPLGRSSSVLYKGSPSQFPEHVQSEQSEAGGYHYQSTTKRFSRFLSSQENVQAETTAVEGSDDPSGDYEKYYRGHEQQPRFETPQDLENVHQSPDKAGYHPDVYGQPHQQQYQHPQESEEYPDSLSDYPRQAQYLASSPYDSAQDLRSASQQSLNPPSPTLHPEQPGDSRPSTATNQSRHSAHSAALQPNQHPMPRSEPMNGGMRQQMGQQRDPRLDEQLQNPYSSQSDPRMRMPQPGEQGRASPAPRNRDNPREMDYETLLQKHEELRKFNYHLVEIHTDRLGIEAKYSKVKRYYFDKESQVTQLQNTVANQRMSMSRTSLDDAQYVSRFDRLNLAIRDLARELRKSWVMIPPWLAAGCTPDVHKAVHKEGSTEASKEMTAIGRAYLTRWIYENIFNLHFHPALELGLSAILKRIERNIRNNGIGQNVSEEQVDDVTAKITNWRLVTIEGLQDILNNSHDKLNDFASFTTSRLIDGIKPLLTDPSPPTLPSQAQAIVELAAGILMNLPNESRDVYVEWYPPGTMISDTHMKMEGGIAPLTHPSSLGTGRDEDGESIDEDNQDPQSIENEIREASARAAMRQGSQSDSGSGMPRGDTKSKKASGFFGHLVGKKPGNSSQRDGNDDREVESNEGKIRYSIFVAVEIRGKAGKDGTPGGNVLYKAPCIGY